MNWIGPIVGVGVAIALGLFLYWQLIIAEGTYLGPRIVVLLYDWSAHIYERIKQYDSGDEQWFLGIPLARALEFVPAPLILDVATGTGRLPRAVLRQPAFDGRVIGLDLSRRMLNQATRETAQFSDRITYIWQDAQDLPFEDNTFDAVACLEALEFTPNPRSVLGELVRVLRPGGVLLVTNRIGDDARLLPARAFPREQFKDVLATLSLESVKVRPWQVDYDLAWAVKTGTPRGGGIRPLLQFLHCPACNSQLLRQDRSLVCEGCHRVYSIGEDDVIELARARH